MNAYYIEINVICIILLALVIINQPRVRSGILMSHRIFGALVWSTILFCSVDILQLFVSGRTYTGARSLNEILNIIYIELPTLQAYIWLLYTKNHIEGRPFSGKANQILITLPLFAVTVVGILNPFTHFLFSLDEANIYQRESGLYLNWIVSWGYFAAATVLVLRQMKRESNNLKRRELRPMLIFIIPPALGCGLQMVLYGLPLVQAGVMIAIELLFMDMQGHRILTDELTGLNNRRGLQAYIGERLRNGNKTSQIFVVMIDIDHFKSINDIYGHTEGDQALLLTATALKASCGKMPGRLYLSRYGGDEFVIVGYDRREEEIQILKERIRQELDHACENRELPYRLSVSIGAVSGVCEDFENIDMLLRLSDKAMYQEKAKHHSKDK